MKQYIPFIGAFLWFVVLSFIVPTVWVQFLSETMFAGILYPKFFIISVVGIIALWPMILPNSLGRVWLSLTSLFIILLSWYTWDMYSDFNAGLEIHWLQLPFPGLLFFGLYPGIWISQLMIVKLRTRESDDLWFQSLLGIIPFISCFASSALFVALYVMEGMHFVLLGYGVIVMWMALLSPVLYFRYMNKTAN